MKKIVILFFVVGAGGAMAYALWYHGKNADGDKNAETQRARAERGPIRLTVASTGRVVSNLDVEIKCKASGQIMQLTKDVSDEVAPGELLLVLDPVDENRNVQRAEVQTSASMARLAQARLNLRTAEEQLDNDEMTAKANLRSADAANLDAQAKADRMRQLLESERVSKEECETAETAATRASVELENARIRLKEIEVERRSLDVRREDVRLAEAQLESDRISLDTARQRLKETKVYAPTTAGDTTATRVQLARSVARSRPGGFGGERGSLDGQRRGFGRAGGSRGSGGFGPGMAGRRFGGRRRGDPTPPDGDTPTTRAGAAPDRAGSRPGGMRGGRFEGMQGRRGSPEGRGFGGRRGDGQREFNQFDLEMARQRFREAGGPGAAPGEDDSATTGPRWVVATRDVQIGQIISSPMNNVGGGTALMTLSDLSRIFVIASVDESQIGQVALGQRVIITADAFPDRQFEGVVMRIATKGLNVSNVVTFEVKIEVSGRDKDKLKPEMTANVEIVVAEGDDALLIPSEAIVREGRQRFVQLAGTEGAPPEKREVTTGIDDGFQVEILAGLQQGDEVVVPELGTQSRWARGMPDAMRQRMRSGMMMRGMRGGRGRR